MQHSTYLESKVLTAPPQRLHLMLIEGAIRFGRQAEELLRKGERAAAAMYEHWKLPKQLMVMKGAEHHFLPEREKLVKRVADWFKETL